MNLIFFVVDDELSEMWQNCIKTLLYLSFFVLLFNISSGIICLISQFHTNRKSQIAQIDETPSLKNNKISFKKFKLSNFRITANFDKNSQIKIDYASALDTNIGSQYTTKSIKLKIQKKMSILQMRKTESHSHFKSRSFLFRLPKWI